MASRQTVLGDAAAGVGVAGVMWWSVGQGASGGPAADCGSPWSGKRRRNQRFRPVLRTSILCAIITHPVLACVVNYASGRWIKESSLLMTAPTSFGRAMPMAVRSRLLTSMIRTRWD